MLGVQPAERGSTQSRKLESGGYRASGWDVLPRHCPGKLPRIGIDAQGFLHEGKRRHTGLSIAAHHYVFGRFVVLDDVANLKEWKLVEVKKLW